MFIVVLHTKSEYILQCALLVFGVLIVTSAVNPWILIPTVPIIVLFVFIRRYFLCTSRAVKRLEATSKQQCIYYTAPLVDVYLYTSKHNCNIPFSSYTQRVAQCIHIYQPVFRVCRPSEHTAWKRNLRRNLIPTKTCTGIPAV